MVLLATSTKVIRCFILSRTLKKRYFMFVNIVFIIQMCQQLRQKTYYCFNSYFKKASGWHINFYRWCTGKWRYTGAWCSISSVSRAACAVIRSLSVITESIDITVMDVACALINIWNERKKSSYFCRRAFMNRVIRGESGGRSNACLGCFCFGLCRIVLHVLNMIYRGMMFHFQCIQGCMYS